MQITSLFSLPESWAAAHPMDASDWRTRWVAAGIGTFDQWNNLRVVAVRNLVWVISGSPAANEWLQNHLDAIAGEVAATVDDAVPLEVRERSIGVRKDADSLWAYRIPRFVACKGSTNWKPHFEPALDQALLDRMTRSIEASLRRELTAWGRLPEVLADGQPFMVISNPGRPVVIPAIHANRSGHGKSVSVLTRSAMVLMSPFRLEGEFFAGPLSSIGYGRLQRTSAPEMLDRRTQRALLTLPHEHEAPSCI